MSEPQILHIFGGKGGAGKGTLSAAFAVQLSENHPKQKVLLCSFGPGGALSDLLKKKLSDKPTKILPGAGSGGLFAQEGFGDSGAASLQARLARAVGEGSRVGAVLGDADLKAIFEQATHRQDEVSALLSLSEWLDQKEFDRVVLDAGTTGQMIRLLDSTSALRRWLSLVKWEGKGADRAKKKGDAASPGEVDALIGSVERLQGLLKDSTKTAFHLVSLAEPVSEGQTRALFAQLKERGFTAHQILINEIEDRTGCPACQGRRGLQAPHVRKLQQLDKAVGVQLLARREVGPRGLDAIRKFSKEWAVGKEVKSLEFTAAEGPPALVRAPSMPPIAAPPLPPTRLIFFIGQGGVGKSSCAAAAAVTLTEKEGPVLLISTDPAHSLSEVLLSRLTDTESQVKGTKGLYARELDTTGWFHSLKKRWKEKAEAALGGKGAEPTADREVLRNLLDCAPPGIDELPAMSVLTDALVQERFKRIVVDPSPAGDGLRVLDLPSLVRPWLTALYGVFSRQRAQGLGGLADEVSAMLKHVKRFEEALASPSESRFVVVTRGEELAIAKTERLVESLKERKLAVERVLVNRVLPKSGCAKCENRRKLELIAAKNIEKKAGLPITVAPALGRHPAGLRELKAFRTAWYALSATAKIKAA